MYVVGHPPCCRRLLAVLRRRFLEAGGSILEQHTFKSAKVYDDGVTIQLLPSTIGAAAIEPGDVNRPMALQHDQHAAPSSSSSRSSSSSSNGPPQRRREVTARLLVDCMVSKRAWPAGAGSKVCGMLYCGCLQFVPHVTGTCSASACMATSPRL